MPKRSLFKHRSAGEVLLFNSRDLKPTDMMEVDFAFVSEGRVFYYPAGDFLETDHFMKATGGRLAMNLNTGEVVGFNGSDMVGIPTPGRRIR